MGKFKVLKDLYEMFEGTNLVLNSESAPSNISYTKLSLSYTKLSKLIIYLHAKFPL